MGENTGLKKSEIRIPKSETLGEILNPKSEFPSKNSRWDFGFRASDLPPGGYGGWGIDRFQGAVKRKQPQAISFRTPSK